MRFPFFSWGRQLFSRFRQGKKSGLLVPPSRDIALIRRIHGRRLPRVYRWRHIRRIFSSGEVRLLKISVLVLCVGLIWAGTVFLNRYREEVPTVGGKYTEAIVGAPLHINPVFSSINDVDQDIVRLVYSGLMRYDEKQRLVPDIAVKYDVSEDKKVYTFELRRDVLWHDGEPLKATDIVFTIETIQNPAVNSPLRVSFDGVLVEAVDDFTVRFTLPKPFNPFLSTLTVGILPEHVWFDIQPENIILAQRNLQPVGSGPYMFSKLFKDDTGFIYEYQLKRFDRYYRQPPFIQEFSFRFFSEYGNTTGAIVALREQKTDGLSYVPYDLREKVERKYIVLHTLHLPQYTAVFFNQNKEPALEDKDVRQALRLAIDKDRIVKESLGGEGTVIASPLLAGFPGYDASIKDAPTSIEEANTLLDKNWKRVDQGEFWSKRKEDRIKEWDAAHPASTSTPIEASPTSTRDQAIQDIEQELAKERNDAQIFFRQNKKGETLEITLVTADTPEYKQAVQRIAGFWQEIGVKTQLVFEPPKDIARDVLKNRSYDALLYSIIIGSDPDQYPFWHSSQINSPGLNLSHYVNRNADALLVKARESTDEKEIVDLYKKFQDMILADQPAIFLYTPTYTYVTADHIHGVELSTIFTPSDRFNGVTNWYIKTKKKWKM